ncbi:MAG: AraC family transcriptional regulator [Bacteroidetes bacterium]|nr:AraC family transcriptional regulator [Bacteroidota bacterium]
MITRKQTRPVGILHRTPVPAGAHFERYEPSTEHVRAFVEHYWGIRWNLAVPVRRMNLSHPSFHVVIEPGRSFVYGVPSRTFERVLEGNSWVFGIKFHPGAFRPLLKGPAAGYTDRTVRLSSIFGAAGTGFQRSMLWMEDEESKIVAAESFLREVLPEPDERTALVRRITGTVQQEREIVTVEQIGARFGFGIRSLQRLFHDAVGITPKWLIKRYRLHDAVETIKDGGSIDWAQLALRLGYFDQAHFIREFRTFTGRSPAEFGRSAR